MKVAYFDCPSGAAGDMIMGALVDAGLPFDTLAAALDGLGLPGYTLERRDVMKGAFRATKVDVHVHDHAGLAEHRHPEPHGRHAHPHRTLPAILAIIERSALPGPVKAAASRIFTRLAEAEGRAHGTAPEAVEFHDVGAVDAIVDITGACAALHLLGIEAVHCSALPIGGGIVRGPHGPMPVPAPGTAELLRGFPVVDTGVRRELVTPTGAAILTTLAVSAGRMPAMTVRSVGYGAGTMELETPNVVRVFVGEALGAAGHAGAARRGHDSTAREPDAPPGCPQVVSGEPDAAPGCEDIVRGDPGAAPRPHVAGGEPDAAPGGPHVAHGVETILQVETTIDDMSPQLYEPLMDALFAAGALDVHLTPVLMKKSRPGVVVTALCMPSALDAVRRACFAESTTIGVRWTTYHRSPLPREIVMLETRLGPLAFKVSRLDGRVVTVTPEFDEVRRIAAARGMSVRDALDQARADARRLLA